MTVWIPVVPVGFRLQVETRQILTAPPGNLLTYDEVEAIANAAGPPDDIQNFTSRTAFTDSLAKAANATYPGIQP